MSSNTNKFKFVSDNLGLYRDVTEAVRYFEQQVESILRSIAEDHEADLARSAFRCKVRQRSPTSPNRTLKSRS